MALYYKKIFPSREEAMIAKRDIGFKHLYIINGDYCYKSLVQTDEYYTDMSEHMSDESDIVSLVKEEPDHVRIYRFIPVADSDLNVAPIERNYITGLVTRLQARRTFNHGELNKIYWYGDGTTNDLIIKVDVAYERDTIGFAVRRTTTRTWLREDGTDATPNKYTEKFYNTDLLGAIDEGIRRRGNIVKGLQLPILGTMTATIPALSGESEPERQARIITIGRRFLGAYKEHFNAFVEDSNKQIIEEMELANDFWLDNIIDANGTTIRMMVLYELNIGGIG
jgi:hypothetical protein